MPHMTKAEIAHLKRLIAWVECEAGQSPEEMVTTVRKIALTIGDVSEEGKARLVEAHQKASNVPKYVWAAIKALRKTLEQHLGDVVDAEWREDKQLKAPNVKITRLAEGESGVAQRNES